MKMPIYGYDYDFSGEDEKGADVLQILSDVGIYNFYFEDKLNSRIHLQMCWKNRPRPVKLRNRESLFIMKPSIFVNNI